jgi:hypothetical protein
VAERILADRVALWALANLAMLHRAADFTFRLVALDFAFGASKLLAAGRALRRFTDRLTDLVAHRLVALPLALRMAVICITAVAARGVAPLSTDVHS